MKNKKNSFFYKKKNIILVGFAVILGLVLGLGMKVWVIKALDIGSDLDLRGNYKVIRTDTPTDANDVATKDYVDSANYLLKSGDSMNGNLDMSENTINMSDGDIHYLHELEMQDWDDNGGGGNNNVRLLARDDNWMFYDGGFVVGSYSNNSIGDVGTGNMVVEGNVGIGATNPAYALDVVGDIRASNRLRAGSASIAGTADIGGTITAYSTIDVGSDFITFQNDDGEYYLGGANTQDAAASGVHLETGSNPDSGDPIFVVESSGNSERLRVEHDGVTSTSNDFHADGSVGRAGVWYSWQSDNLYDIQGWDNKSKLDIFAQSYGSTGEIDEEGFFDTQNTQKELQINVPGYYKINYRVNFTRNVDGGHDRAIMTAHLAKDGGMGLGYVDCYIRDDGNGNQCSVSDSGIVPISDTYNVIWVEVYEDKGNESGEDVYDSAITIEYVAPL